MGISVEVRGQLVLRFRVLFPHLNERQQRLVLGQEARLLGHGGVRAVARAAGVSETTVRAGVFELEAGEDPLPDGRVRRPGGGRRAAEDLDPDLVPALLALVEPDERGDPMSPLRWTTKSLRNLAEELTRQGYPVSAPTVGRLLREQGFSLQANTKTLEGKQHPDRDAQFRYVNEQVKAHQVAGQPVISVDAKKKEQLGHLPNAGRLWRPKGDPVQVEDHSFFFTGPDVPHAIPFGIYDMTADRGWVNVGVDHNTSAFAVASIRGWWTARGRHDYPNATRLLVTADAGGSNSCRYRLWKAELADFAAETGLAITVCHFPPGTSKWNKIEHRLFSHITMNWRGRPLTSHEVVVNLIAATRTQTGLRVEAALDTNTYPLGVSVSTERLKALPIAPHVERGTWNYTIHPAEQDRQAAAGPGQRQRARAAALHDLADPRLTGMSRRELEELAAELAPLQDARFEQRHFERRGGPRRQAKGKHGRPMFNQCRQGPDRDCLSAADLLSARAVRDAGDQHRADRRGDHRDRRGPGRAQAPYRADRPAFHQCGSAAGLPGNRHRPEPAESAGDPGQPGADRDEPAGASEADRAAGNAASRPGPATQPPPTGRGPAERSPRRHLLRKDHRRRTRPRSHPRPAQDLHLGDRGRTVRGQPTHHRQRQRLGPPATGPGTMHHQPFRDPLLQRGGGTCRCRRTRKRIGQARNTTLNPNGFCAAGSAG